MASRGDSTAFSIRMRPPRCRDRNSVVPFLLSTHELPSGRFQRTAISGFGCITGPVRWGVAIPYHRSGLCSFLNPATRCGQFGHSRGDTRAVISFFERDGEQLRCGIRPSLNAAGFDVELTGSDGQKRVEHAGDANGLALRLSKSKTV